jgi:UDP-N-acetylglucosamine 2-epimerase (non-hydrolysing)
LFNQKIQTNQTNQINQMNQTDQNNLSSLARLMAGQWKKGAIPPLWDGRAAERIVGQLGRLLFSS